MKKSPKDPQKSNRVRSIRACARLGLTHDQTADALGCSRSTIAHHASLEGIRFRRGRPPKKEGK